MILINFKNLSILKTHKNEKIALNKKIKSVFITDNIFCAQQNIFFCEFLRNAGNAARNHSI